MLTYTQQSDYPVAKVDVILTNERGEVLLTRRAVEPFKDFWDIPGGTLEYTDASAEEGARREIREELGIECALTRLVGVYSDPARDPRYHIVALIYAGVIKEGAIHLGPHTTEYQWSALDALPADIGFDHRIILEDYKKDARARGPFKRRMFENFKNTQPEYYDAKFFKKVRLAADALIIKNESILLARRCKEPFLGKWDIPGGHIFVGETMEQCLAREVYEELGVQCKVGALFGVYSDRGRDPRAASAVAFYFVELLSEQFEENIEVNEFRYFPLDNLPPQEEVAYHNHIVLEDVRDYFSKKQ
ncbi:MAG: NUDIX hydrolase [Candidatus Magasanikbacteria bacterium]|nr:NUDIX hydrolase [Candidatus Magasanikbacteria bacterium]